MQSADEPPSERRYPRAYPLTPEQLRRAYQERGWSDIYDRLAETRLAMLCKEQKAAHGEAEHEEGKG